MQVNEKYNIVHLEWDTIFFGVNSAKIVLKKEINNNDVDDILRFLIINNYEFVTIQNTNNNENNNYVLKNLRNSFLADVNIQFVKNILQINEKLKKSKNIAINNKVKPNEDIINISKESFMYSRFLNDKNLKNGDKIYYEWTKNAFERDDKFFCVYQINERNVGYILFSIDNNEITIELIAVDKDCKGKGIGHELINDLENFAKENNINNIKVGTQINNIYAQNFYQSCGFKHITNHSIYHLWLKKENEL